jgi:hypothetical protein
MTTAFVTPTYRVDIRRKGKYKLEARHPVSGRLLGTAVCSHGSADSERFEWIGWCVQVGGHSKVVDTHPLACELLIELTSVLVDEPAGGGDLHHDARGVLLRGGR